MSLDINQIALHQLIKRDEQNLELVLRDSLLEPTETVVEMVAELHRVYSAKNKAYGLFSEESELAQTLRLQRQGEEDFLAFSRAATGRLRDELAKYPFADGGIRAVLPLPLSGGGVSAGGSSEQPEQYAR
ncbi:nucleoid-associated protein [Escherichia coli]|uniref:Nucleoid-associated protein n=1 Tax=Escherichia coli TaxID=562 RepID=A0A376RGB6_ECOLX|nr:nucleoid-associated protein [Escherichia coli]